MRFNALMENNEIAQTYLPTNMYCLLDSLKRILMLFCRKIGYFQFVRFLFLFSLSLSIAIHIIIKTKHLLETKIYLSSQTATQCDQHCRH